MYFCNFYNGKKLYDDVLLVIENSEDLLIWYHMRKEALDNAICHVVSCLSLEEVLVKYTDIPLYLIAKEYTTDGIAQLGAYECKGILDWTFVSNDILKEQVNSMLKELNNNKVLIVNKNGGYFTHSRKEIELEESAYINFKQGLSKSSEDLDTIRRFINNGVVPVILPDDSYNFCYVKGRCIYEKVLLHDVILSLNNIDCDKAFKLTYYPSKNEHEHRVWCDYGIQGLRLSVVYNTVEEPFKLTKSDLDCIENFIKDNFETTPTLVNR